MYRGGEDLSREKEFYIVIMRAGLYRMQMGIVIESV
jgi:hypothetical protein